jgi:hypothetical protein
VSSISSPYASSASMTMTRNKVRFLVVVGVAVLVIATAYLFLMPSDLAITYGSAGIRTIAYRDSVLEDTSQYPDDSLHIGHMKITDMSGRLVTGGPYVWGETNSGKRWDSATRSWTYSYPWGSIVVRFSQKANVLNMDVSETNSAGSGVIFDGASIVPFGLHFSQVPDGFGPGPFPRLSDNSAEPAVMEADFGQGTAVLVAPSSDKPLYTGFMRTSQSTVFSVLVSSTTPDGLAAFQPHLDRPVMPGQTDHFVVSLRFASQGTPFRKVADDAYRNWAATWPQSVHWTDRRAMGAVYLATAPTSQSPSDTYANNPRRYFNDVLASDFDVTTDTGLAAFQHRIIEQAKTVVQNLHRMNAQGAITWDIEGEQFPHETSYVCSPDQIGTVAPEMESIIHDPSSPYANTKLDDTYFKIMRDAGLAVGVCVRPQHFSLNPDGSAVQSALPPDQTIQELTRKIRFAHERWGARLFYIDSAVDAGGAPLQPSLLQELARSFPDSLLIPEESMPRTYAYAAPLKSFLFHGDSGTDSSVYDYYPQAFSVNMINDASPDKLAAARPELVQAVAHGDVLMVFASFWHANNSTVQEIYAAAKNSAPNSAAH